MADPMPKTVKGMDPDRWEKALRHAKMRGEPLAEWLGRAIDAQADLERGDQVIPPAEKGRPAGGPTGSAPAVIPTVNLAEIETAMRAAQAVSAASGVPVPKTAARHCFAILTGQLRAARGMPPVQPRQTRPQIGQTIEGVGK